MMGQDSWFRSAIELLNCTAQDEPRRKGDSIAECLGDQ
jgi:hypothetical protein